MILYQIRLAKAMSCRDCDELLDELIALQALSLMVCRNITNWHIGHAKESWPIADTILIKESLDMLRDHLVHRIGGGDYSGDNVPLPRRKESKH